MKTTYLYIKTHNISGLKYFGKTTANNPNEYLGSGIHWKRHVKKHGKDISTEIVGCFDDEISLQLYAYEFSFINDIVKSEKWANLKDESGIDGGWFALNQDANAFSRRSRGGKKSHENHPGLAAENIKKGHSADARLKAKTTLLSKDADYFKNLAKRPKKDHEGYIKNLSKAISGMKVINNGITVKRAKGDQLNEFLNSGWQLGYLKNDDHLVKRIKIQCPYCEVTGAINTMTRWHFDNCKKK